MNGMNGFRPGMNQMMQQSDLQQAAMSNQIGISLPGASFAGAQPQGRSPTPGGMKSMFPQPQQSALMSGGTAGLSGAVGTPPVAPFFGPQQTMGVGQPMSADAGPMMQSALGGGSAARSMQNGFSGGRNQFSGGPSYQPEGMGGGGGQFAGGMGGGSQFHGQGGGGGANFQGMQQFQGGGGQQFQGGNQQEGGQDEEENGNPEESEDEEDSEDEDENKERGGGGEDKEELDPGISNGKSWQSVTEI